MKTLRLALAQINPTVGSIKRNSEKIISFIEDARRHSADIVAFPELCITGYPPEDLLLKPSFLKDNIKALDEIKRHTNDITAVVGFADKQDDIYNAAALLYNHQIIDIYHKIFLPNYGVFDELRYFQSGTLSPVYEIAGCLVGLNICEDIWYPDGPAYKQSLAGAELIININASPYGFNKSKAKDTMLSARAFDNRIILAYLNTVGGQDELVFDGGSTVYDSTGEVLARAGSFTEELIVVDLDMEGVFVSRLHDPRRRQKVKALCHNECHNEIKRVFVCDRAPGEKSPLKLIKRMPVRQMDRYEEIYNALVLGTRDYVTKNGFKSVVIGLSGGIDSSIVACIAVDAIGPENVRGIFMPSPYTSQDSREDVCELSENLKIRTTEIPIAGIFSTYLGELTAAFDGKAADTTEENLQARIRGNILMAMSNKFGPLVLTTGNKSEMSAGYATLYGDMAGGFAVIKDVPKMMVYKLSRWRNSVAAVIPERVLTKAPTAELRPNQKDSDSLPPYEILDIIIESYVEKEMGLEEITALGIDELTVRKALSLIDGSEYKRRQSPPGIKITGRAFGKDRRFPITNGYRGF
ncbi:NAD+ synthase [Candidatus Magnetominusculus xianensis]|uniref:NAD+ synthase n=1 Tax=Candidatus Magnetominusculus xianensis TaxID=1748249 RepID=UPI0012ED391D|nr:NAD+ synthase [Nitrospirota bacterium]